MSSLPLIPRRRSLHHPSNAAEGAAVPKAVVDFWKAVRAFLLFLLDLAFFQHSSLFFA